MIQVAEEIEAIRAAHASKGRRGSTVSQMTQSSSHSQESLEESEPISPHNQRSPPGAASDPPAVGIEMVEGSPSASNGNSMADCTSARRMDTHGRINWSLAPLPPSPPLASAGPLLWLIVRTDAAGRCRVASLTTQQLLQYTHQGNMSHAPPVCSLGTTNSVLTGMTKVVNGPVRW